MAGRSKKIYTNTGRLLEFWTQSFSNKKKNNNTPILVNTGHLNPISIKEGMKNRIPRDNAKH